MQLAATLRRFHIDTALHERKRGMEEMYRMARGWLFPYVCLEVMCETFQPVTVHLFLEHTWNVDCCCCMGCNNGFNDITEEVARRVVNSLSDVKLVAGDCTLLDSKIGWKIVGPLSAEEVGKSTYQLEDRVHRTGRFSQLICPRAVPIFDYKGEIVELVSTNGDGTAEKGAEPNYRQLAEALDAELRARTQDLQERTVEVERQSEQVRELNWRLLQAQDEERRHIARELHDSAGQTLTVLDISLVQLVQKAMSHSPELASDAETIHEMIQHLYRDIRTASYLLHPPLLDEGGLYSALSCYIEGLVERSGLEIKLEISQNFGRLPCDMELVIFRLVQECLNNIHRHSGSKMAGIRIARATTEVTAEIRDQGSGMSAAKLVDIQSERAGVGIRGMRERLRQFKGEIRIQSDSTGTRVLATIPVPNSAVAPDDSRTESIQCAV